MKNGFCDSSQLGRFIIDRPSGKSLNDTSFWYARVGLSRDGSASDGSSEVSIGGFWDNPAGNPTLSEEDANYTSPWRRDSEMQVRQASNPSPSGILWYSDPIQYIVRKTGYYCVGR